MDKALSNTICIITQSHLCQNPRVLKEAITLAKEGYKVYIINSIYSQSLLLQDASAIKGYNISITHVSDLTKSTFNSFTDRLVNKSGRIMSRYLNWDTAMSLGYGAKRYFKISSNIKADLYICHQELATYVGTQLLRSGFKVAFDFEDWYSEDLLPSARAERPIRLIKKTESIALNKGTFCLTTSNSLAKALADAYNCKQPAVMYNVFVKQLEFLQVKELSTPLKLFWFSQTIGPGRGLEQFIKLLASISSNIELHLLGNISDDYKKILTSLMPGRHHLYFHKPVKEKQLAYKIAQFDIGLALELNTPVSRNLTITNKFFQYLQSGLPIIASETKGQNEAFDQFTPGFKIAQNPSSKEISQLDKWLNNSIELKAARERAIKAANFYNWENEGKKLVAIVKEALDK